MTTTNTLEQLRLKQVSINGIDIQKEHIVSIQLFESIAQPGITGFIDMMDYQGVVEKGNVYGYDEIKIVFTVEGQSDLTLSYVINANEGGKMLPEQQYNTVRLGFCSKWLIDGLGMMYSKNWSNKYIHEIVKDLIEACGGKPGIIEPTKQKHEIFVSPYWTPYHIIKYLLTYATNEAGKGGYLCWTNLKDDTVNVTTIDKMLSGSFGKYESFVTFPENPRYHGRIHHLTVETNYDIIRLINNGGAGLKVYGFNYDKKEVVFAEDPIAKIKQSHLSQKYPLPATFTEGKKYYNFMYTPLFPNTKASIASDDAKIQDLVDGLQQSVYSYLTTDVFKINVLTGGDPDRRVGWLATLDFPSQNKNVKGHDSEIYAQYKGDYLIRDINHTFSYHTEYKQAICLAADGFKIFSRDATKWG